MGQRVLLYSHDTYGLGNLRRNHQVALSLVTAAPRSEVIIVTSSRWLHFFEPHPRIRFLKLPEVMRVDRGSYRPRSDSIQMSSMVRVRRAVLEGLSKAFRPDLFLADKSPLGIMSELNKVIPALRKRGCKTVLVLRDILDDPEWVKSSWHSSGKYQALDSFDQVWILGDEAVYPSASAYALVRPSGPKVHYCGYLSRSEEVRIPKSFAGSNSETKPVLATVGGGGDGLVLLRELAATLEFHRGNLRPLDVVLGPEFPVAQEAGLVEQLSRRKNVRVSRFDSNIPARVRSSAGVIAMAGYNTICEVLSTETPALIVPRQTPTQEQSIRAREMSRRGYFKVSHASRLQHDLGQFLNRPHQDAFPRPDMTGMNRIHQLAVA